MRSERRATGLSNTTLGLGLLGVIILLCVLAFVFIWRPIGDWTPAGRTGGSRGGSDPAAAPTSTSQPRSAPTGPVPSSGRHGLSGPASPLAAGREARVAFDGPRLVSPR